MNDKIHNIIIYQINLEKDKDNVAFKSLEELKEITGSKNPDPKIYDQVFEGKVKADKLEDMFAIFNTVRPKNFTGHSLAVSDIIYVKEKDSYYYCDDLGFVKIKFIYDIKENYTMNFNQMCFDDSNCGWEDSFNKVADVDKERSEALWKDCLNKSECRLNKAVDDCEAINNRYSGSLYGECADDVWQNIQDYMCVGNDNDELTPECQKQLFNVLVLVFKDKLIDKWPDKAEEICRHLNHNNCNIAIPGGFKACPDLENECEDSDKFFESLENGDDDAIDAVNTVVLHERWKKGSKRSGNSRTLRRLGKTSLMRFRLKPSVEYSIVDHGHFAMRLSASSDQDAMRQYSAWYKQNKKASDKEEIAREKKSGSYNSDTLKDIEKANIDSYRTKTESIDFDESFDIEESIDFDEAVEKKIEDESKAAELVEKVNNILIDAFAENKITAFKPTVEIEDDNIVIDYVEADEKPADEEVEIDETSEEPSAEIEAVDNVEAEEPVEECLTEDVDETPDTDAQKARAEELIQAIAILFGFTEVEESDEEASDEVLDTEESEDESEEEAEEKPAKEDTVNDVEEALKPKYVNDLRESNSDDLTDEVSYDDEFDDDDIIVIDEDDLNESLDEGLTFGAIKHYFGKLIVDMFATAKNFKNGIKTFIERLKLSNFGFITADKLEDLKAYGNPKAAWTNWKDTGLLDDEGRDIYVVFRWVPEHDLFYKEGDALVRNKKDPNRCLVFEFKAGINPDSNRGYDAILGGQNLTVPMAVPASATAIDLNDSFFKMFENIAEKYAEYAEEQEARERRQKADADERARNGEPEHSYADERRRRGPQVGEFDDFGESLEVLDNNSEKKPCKFCQQIHDLLKDEEEAIDGYDTAIKMFNDSDIPVKDDLVDEFGHIKEEELEHIDELRTAEAMLKGSRKMQKAQRQEDDRDEQDESEDGTDSEDVELVEVDDD